MLGWTLWDVSGRFATLGMFGDVLECLEHKPIYCITIYKQVSTCFKDDAIIPRGKGLGLAGPGWPESAWVLGFTCMHVWAQNSHNAHNAGTNKLLELPRS